MDKGNSMYRVSGDMLVMHLGAHTLANSRLLPVQRLINGSIKPR